MSNNISINGTNPFDDLQIFRVKGPAEFVIKDLYELSGDDIDKCVSFLQAFKSRENVTMVFEESKESGNLLGRRSQVHLEV